MDNGEGTDYGSGVRAGGEGERRKKSNNWNSINEIIFKIFSSSFFSVEVLHAILKIC